jgi:hypothetical protein
MKNNKNISVPVFASLIILMLEIFSGCPQSVVEPPVASFTLTAEDIGVTEISIHIKATVDHIPWKFSIHRYGLLPYTSGVIRHPVLDTVVTDQYLLPHKEYMYKVYYILNNTVTDSSAPLPVTTMILFC